MPQLSAAWLDLWHTEWIPSKEERLTLLRLVKKSSETVTTVLWMLEVAQGQSNINSDENYIFLSRIDGIIAYLERVNWPLSNSKKEQLIHEVWKSLKIREDLVNSHISWRRLTHRENMLPEIIRESLKRITEKNQGRDWSESLKDMIKIFWDRVDKKRLKWIVSNITDYQMILKYYYLRYYWKDLKSIIKNN